MPLIANKQARGLSLEAGNPLSGFNISHGAIAGTKLPGPFCDKTHKIAYWDCPGFGDPRGSKADIQNAFSIHELFTNYSRAKILLAFPESLLESRAPGFIKLLNDITELFKDEQQLQQGLSLIITKQRDSDPHEALSQILSEAKKGVENAEVQITIRGLSLLESLVNNKQRVSSFPYPQQEGKYPADNKEIFKCIEATNYMDNPKFIIRVNAESHSFVEELAKNLNQTITDNVRRNGPLGIFCCHRNMINTHKGTAEELRQKLKGLENDLSNLQKVEDFKNNPQPFADGLAKFFNPNTIRKAMKGISFLKKIDGNIEYRIENWCSALSESKEKIQKLAIGPTSTYTADNLSLKGALIGTTDIGTAIRGSQHPIRKVDVFGSHAFLIDENLTSHGTSIGIKAPLWKVQDTERIIDLSGKDGASHKKSSAADGRTKKNQGANGKEGVEGQHGGDGGNFEGHGHSFLGLANLTIKSDGGKGGQGQNGGNGANGQDGTDADTSLLNNITNLNGEERENILIKREECTWSMCERPLDYAKKGFKSLFTFNGKFKETYESRGTSGEKGGNGGQGGCGGPGGQAGKILINNQHLENVKIEANKGEKGLDGEKGSPGKGGKNGRTYSGVYENEYFMPAVRKIKNYSLPNNIIQEGMPISVSASLGIGTAAFVATEQTVIEGLKVVVKEAGKEALGETGKAVIKAGGEKIIVTVGSNVLIEEGKVIIKEGGKLIIKKGVGALAEGAKVTALAASPWISGMVSGLLVNGVLSVISSQVSTGWMAEGPKFIDEGNASDGEDN